MTGGWPGHLLAVEVHLRPVLVELGATVPARGLYVTEPELADLDAAVAKWSATATPLDQDLNPKNKFNPVISNGPCPLPSPPGLTRTPGMARPARCPESRCVSIVAAEPGQPFSDPSIFKGVQPPTETLPASLEAWQRLSVLYQTHALALKKLAFLMTGDQPTAEDVVAGRLPRPLPSLAVAGRHRQGPRLPPHQRPQRLPVGAPGPVPSSRHHPRRARGQRVGRGHRHPGRGQPRRSWSRSGGCPPDSARPSSSATTWT